MTVTRLAHRRGQNWGRSLASHVFATLGQRVGGTVKRQRTILGVVMREVQRKLDAMKASHDDDAGPPPSPKAMSDLGLWPLQRARLSH